MMAMVALFPGRQLGVELGAILLIFTGQVWNMAFSFYASLKAFPKEMREAATIYRFSRWQRFTQMELPFSAIGLVWNSMMSVAGGWFALMVCEMFVLGQRDFRLPGFGSYLQTAASAGDTTSIMWGVATMVTLIVLLDQFIWRPVIAWAEKFKVEQVESTMLRDPGCSICCNIPTALPGSAENFAAVERASASAFCAEAFGRASARTGGPVAGMAAPHTGLAGNACNWLRCGARCDHSYRPRQAELHQTALGLGATFLRVNLALFLAALMDDSSRSGDRTKSSTRPHRATAGADRRIGSSYCIASSNSLVLIRIGGGLGIASIVVLLLGTQWYVLFNVIAGAMAIPTDLKECCSVFQVRGIERWKKLILPGIFPYLVTGMVTASGGAWNATIVAEYFHFKGHIYTTTGLGATISQATDAGDFKMLIAATIVMAATVVTVIGWSGASSLFLAETRFRLETKQGQGSGASNNEQAQFWSRVNFFRPSATYPGPFGYFRGSLPAAFHHLLTPVHAVATPQRYSFNMPSNQLHGKERRRKFYRMFRAFPVFPTLQRSSFRWIKCGCFYQRVQQFPDGFRLENLLAEMRVESARGSVGLRTNTGSWPRGGCRQPSLWSARWSDLAALLMRVRPDVKVLTNYLLRDVPELARHCIFVDPFQSRRCSQPRPHRDESPSHARFVSLAAERGNAGRLSGRRSFSLADEQAEITDPVWNDTAVRLIRRTGASALPVYFCGRNSVSFHFFGVIHPRLEAHFCYRNFFSSRDEPWKSASAARSHPTPWPVLRMTEKQSNICAGAPTCWRGGGRYQNLGHGQCNPKFRKGTGTCRSTRTDGLLADELADLIPIAA